MDEIFEQLLHLSEHTGTLIVVYDSHDRLQYANSAFRSVYFIEPDESPEVCSGSGTTTCIKTKGYTVEPQFDQATSSRRSRGRRHLDLFAEAEINGITRDLSNP